MAEKVGDVAAELAAFRGELTALTAAVGALVDAQATQGDLLRELLAAATSGESGEDGIGAALREIARAVTRQSDALAGLRTDLAALPGAVAAATGGR